MQPVSQNRRRDKAILSCTFCRGRKLGCDRQSPCGACARRGKPAECVYLCSEQERRDAIDYRPRARNRQAEQARQRIARLENLVTEMRDMAQLQSSQNIRELSAMTASPAAALVSNSPGPSLVPHPQPVGDMGRLSLTDDQTVYTGSSHWVTVLDEIRHLKKELSEEYSNNTTTQQTAPSGAAPPAAKIYLLNSAPSLPREHILAMIPPRKVVDRHVSHFFNAFDMAPFILNRNKFLAEYTNFWEKPSVAPIMWVGLLFSVLSMSAFLQQQDVMALDMTPVDMELRDKLETYRTLTIHCLVAGDYLRPSKYSIETLTLHYSVDQNVNFDGTSIGNWILIGVIIRIALRMGLHRDPSHWPDIRPYQAELRRRLWIILYQMDFFTSTQVGLPRIIKDSQSDTRPPAHLFDHDLGFEHDQLPPERPLTEATSLLFIIQRNTIIKVAAEIYDATESGQPSPASSAVLGAKLSRAIDAIPTWLKYRSLEESFAENPVTILNQMFLDILIHKAVYLLHRRSFVKETTEEGTMSNELCIKASLAILEHQRRMNEETQPGGLMFGIRWKVASALNHEFLQATMMLCFALSRFNEGHGATATGALQRREDILQALDRAKQLWEKNADQSIAARRAAKAISTVLQVDLNKSGLTPDVAVSDDSMGFNFNQLPPGLDAQNYFGNFDYGQNMTLDPSFFANENDVAAFGTTLDEFVTEQGHQT